jgi:phosphoribosyl 1,2-cyclic phosphodiesterase
MTDATTELLLRVNGIQAAFGIEFGLSSPRTDEGREGDAYRQANASYSLVQRHGGQVVRHTLIDCGMGVVPSLLELEQLYGVHCVDEILITHPHFDHFAQLDWLSMCLLRSGRAEQPRPLPIYATPECWENGPARVHRYLVERTDFRPLRPGVDVRLGELTVTPFDVDHGPKAPGAVGFVVENNNPGWGGSSTAAPTKKAPTKKIVITGDFLRVPDEDAPLLRDADVMFLDANTWHPAEQTWHQSVVGDLRLIDKWRPRRAYMTHYSGFEDRQQADDPVHGPMPLAEFRRQLGRVAAGRQIEPAEHGMILGGDVPWP